MKIFSRDQSIQVALTGASVAFSLAGDAAIYTAIPIVFEDLGLLPLQVGILLSVNRVARLVTNTFAHWLVRRVSARTLLVGSLILGSSVTALYSLLPPFLLLVVLRALWGFCWSMLRHVGVMNSAGRSTPHNRGRLVGVYQGVVRGGYFGGTVLAGLLLDTVGLAVMYRMTAGVMLLGIVPVFVAFRPRERVAVKWGASRGDTGERNVASIELLRGFVFGSVGTGIIMSTLGIVLKDISGDSIRIGTRMIGIATITGTLLGMRSLLGIVGSPIMGSLLDRLGQRKGEIAAFLTGGAALLTAYLLPSAIPTVTLILLFSLCELTIGIALTAEMNRSSRVYARFASGLDAGAATGPFLAWVLIDIIGQPRIGFAAASILYAVGLLLSLAIYRRNSKA